MSRSGFFPAHWSRRPLDKILPTCPRCGMPTIPAPGGDLCFFCDTTSFTDAAALAFAAGMISKDELRAVAGIDECEALRRASLLRRRQPQRRPRP